MKVLFQDKEVQKLLDDYQKLVGVRIAVFDTQFNELYSSPKNLSNFCQRIRQNDALNAACRYCDERAFLLAKANRETYMYPCHLGLYEAVTPIYDNQQLLGYVMVGQLLDNSNNKDQKWREINLLYHQHQSTFAPYRKEFDDLKQMSMEEIEAVTNIMKACASSIWLQHLIDVERSPIIERIDNYIEQHYTKKIHTTALCDALYISKTTIYNYLKNEHNMSLTQYINAYRIKLSKEHLKEKKTPIAEVAMAVGFDDYNYYTRVFKKITGETPRQYRKRH